MEYLVALADVFSKPPKFVPLVSPIRCHIEFPDKISVSTLVYADPGMEIRDLLQRLTAAPTFNIKHHYTPDKKVILYTDMDTLPVHETYSYARGPVVICHGNLTASGQYALYDLGKKLINH
jgi:hypothetical protein